MIQKVKKYFDNKAPNWDSGLKTKPDKMKKITEICDLRRGHRVLDIACGTGVMLPYLLDKEPAHLRGVDISDAMANIARSKFCDKRVVIESQDFLKIEWECFDRAMCYNSYPHFLKKAEFAKKVYEVLNMNGRFVIAHGSGRKQINTLHSEARALGCSVPLETAEAEAKWFEPYFAIDVKIDQEGIYVISGVKK